LSEPCESVPLPETSAGPILVRAPSPRSAPGSRTDERPPPPATTLQVIRPSIADADPSTGHQRFPPGPPVCSACRRFPPGTARPRPRPSIQHSSLRAREILSASHSWSAAPGLGGPPHGDAGGTSSSRCCVLGLAFAVARRTAHDKQGRLTVPPLSFAPATTASLSRSLPPPSLLPSRLHAPRPRPPPPSLAVSSPLPFPRSDPDPREPATPAVI
jgi:hypothetical protein